MRKYGKVQFGSLLILAALSFVRYIGNSDSWIIDIVSHFVLQYALIALIFMVVCFWRRYFLMAVLFGFLFILNISSTIDYGETIHASEYAGAPLKIYSANININNDDLSNLIREIQQANPDIVLLLEIIPDHVEQLQSVINAYPYHRVMIFPGKFSAGFIFLSKFPVLNDHVMKLSERCNFFLETTLNINQKAVMFYGVHAQRPYMYNYIERKNQFLWLAGQIKKQTLPVIAAGDFNTTPYSDNFKRLMKITGMKDSREGFGWQLSWPTYFPPFWIPIDHVLVTPDIKVLKRTTGSYIGSDHYPVITEFSLG